MEEHFARLVDYDFTASMEEDLDAIARGDQQRAAWLRRFYFGDEATSADGLRDLVEDLGDIDAARSRRSTSARASSSASAATATWRRSCPPSTRAPVGDGCRGAPEAPTAAPTGDHQRRHRP